MVGKPWLQPSAPPELHVVTQTHVILTLEKWRQEEQRFRVIVGCRASLRPAGLHEEVRASRDTSMGLTSGSKRKTAGYVADVLSAGEGSLFASPQS